MRRINETVSLEPKKYCGLDCPYAKSDKDVPGCMTYTPILCTLYNKIVSKSALCLGRRR